MTDTAVPMVEVLIPTFNEAGHIAQTVANALSARSGDRAGFVQHRRHSGVGAPAGARVVEHAFVDYASQKNWGLDHGGLTAPWVFILDADERITPALRDEILNTLPRTNASGFYVNRLLIFMARTVRHGGLYPSWNLRLFKRGQARYEPRPVHEHVVCDGPTAFLTAELLHIRRENMTRYLDKHIRYADMESTEWVKRRLGQSTGAPESSLFKSKLRYRQWIRRNVWPRLPLRPFWRFAWMYVLRLGFLDGRAGWHLARLMAAYEYMITLLYRDKLRRARNSDQKIT